MVETNQTAGFWPSIYAPLRSAGQRVAHWFSPASEALATQDAYRISLELPGIDEDEIEIIHSGSSLTVRGEKKSSREESGDNWYFCEREYGTFSRTFRLPADADADRITADLKNGVLTLVVPQRAQQEAQGRTIKITKA
jgi:HSP20 family protein